MKLRCMQNSGHRGPHMTLFMTIFLILYVTPPIPNIEKIQLYEVYKSREVSHLFTHATGIMSGNQFSTPVMTIFINVTIWDKSDTPHPHPIPTRHH